MKSPLPCPQARWRAGRYGPGWLGQAATPCHSARRGLRRDLPPLTGEVLDVGGGRMPCCAIVAPVNCLGVLLGALRPGNPDFYLDSVVLARKPAT